MQQGRWEWHFIGVNGAVGYSRGAKEMKQSKANHHHQNLISEFFFFNLSLEAKSDAECSYTAFVKSSLNYNQRTPGHLHFQLLSWVWDSQIKNP